jgi:hypothetical protein
VRIPDWQAKSQRQVRNVTLEKQQHRVCWYVCWKGCVWLICGFIAASAYLVWSFRQCGTANYCGFELPLCVPALSLCVGFNSLNSHVQQYQGICVKHGGHSLLASRRISTGQDVSSTWALVLLAPGICLLVLGSLIQASSLVTQSDSPCRQVRIPDWQAKSQWQVRKVTLAEQHHCVCW